MEKPHDVQFVVQAGDLLRSHPLCTIDFVGGGVMMADVVEWTLCFEPGGSVRLLKRVLEGSLSDVDPGAVCTLDVGTFSHTDRGYLRCVFPRFELLVRPCTGRSDLLIGSVIRGTKGLDTDITFQRVGA